MKYIWNTSDFQLNNTAVSLGKFDGFHIGHRLLIEYVSSLKKAGYTAVTFTFFVHPGFLLSQNAMKLIYTEEEKYDRAKELGSDVLVSYPFNEAVMHMPPEQFIREVLVEKMDAKIVVIGSDYHFGKDRGGNVEMLQEYGKKYGFKVKIFDKIIMDGREVSSTRIREALAAGNMETANKMLGMPFSITGKVIYGNQIGRTLGMPTANICPKEEKLIPPNGVYASRIYIDGKQYEGITNIGYKPTIGNKNEKGVETYIFHFDDNIYGKIIRVDLYAFERGERKFESLEQLQQQMEKDCVFSRQYFISIDS